MSPQARIYYTSVAGLQVYAEPKASSSTRAELPLHQKVYRYRIERGYAYVKVEGQDVTGWIDNGQLIWRLPTTVSSPPSSVKQQEPQETPGQVEPVRPVAMEPPKTQETAVEDLAAPHHPALPASGTSAAPKTESSPPTDEVGSIETALHEAVQLPVAVTILARTDVAVTRQNYASIESYIEAEVRERQQRNVSQMGQISN